MQTGDTVRDGRGRAFQVGQLLGRGLWGKTYSVREEPSGTEYVLKCPLSPDELKQSDLQDYTMQNQKTYWPQAKFY